MMPIAFGQAADIPGQPRLSASDARAQALQTQKKALTPSAQERLTERAKGREIQESAQVGVDITGDINSALSRLPLIIRQQHPTTVIAVLTQVIRGVSVGIRAVGRRKEALQAIETIDEQILEAATQSYEKIVALSQKMEDLMGRKTIGQAIEEVTSLEVASLDLRKSKKILNLLNPSNYLNTFSDFTDDLYITVNKAERWEKIKQLSKDLKEEQDRFDDYIALLQIKLLEKMMMTFHLEKNKDAYVLKLQESLKTIEAAIALTDSKINDLNNKQPAKAGILNRLKKAVGKDATEVQQAKTVTSLKDERQNYIKQKEDVQEKIKTYQEMPVNPDTLKKGREELQQKIKEIQSRRAAKFSPEDLANALIDLKAQIQGIQKEVDSLKASGSSPSVKALNTPNQKKDVQAQIKHYQAMTGD
jgi:hypothetical protein